MPSAADSTANPTVLLLSTSDTDLIAARASSAGYRWANPSRLVSGELDELLAGIGIQRQQVYIANVLKCRPPGNRDPRDEEIDACKGYLREQIRMIHPQVVITLGNFATKLLVPTDVGITRMRGHRIEWWLGAALIPTFHPAAALRGRPEVTEQMREDFSLAATVLEEKTAPVSDPEPVQTSMGLT